MSNPFINPFDPFAAPAVAPSSAARGGGGVGGGNNNNSATNANGGGSGRGMVGAVNPFDSLGSFVSNATSSGNGLWKNVVASATSTGGSSRILGATATSQHLQQQQQQQNSSSSSLSIQQPPRAIKRIVPYNHNTISTLETNWDPWLYAASNSNSNNLWMNNGNFITYLIVQTNAACTGSGVISVENVLKWSKSHGIRNPGGTTTTGGGGASGGGEFLGNFDSSLSLTSEDSMTEEGTAAAEDGVGSSNSGYGASNVMKPKIGGGGGGGMQRFLKSNLKKAQQSLERSVATIAIKADMSKNPDQVCVSLHYLGVMNGGAANVALAHAIGASSGAGGGAEVVSDVCLSRTEWAEIPSSSTSEESRGGAGVPFSIPLCVPDLSFLEGAIGGSSGGGGGVRLAMRLYLRSGATLLKAVANREYCIGECTLPYSNVMQARQAGGGSGGPIRVPFTSGMITEILSGNSNNPGALLIAATPRIKFNPPCTYGWSLTDPISTPPLGGSISSSWLKMFQLPLDSGYVFRLPGRGNTHNGDALPHLLLANERAVESTLTLPLATACSRLFMLAATQSQNLTMEAATKLRRRETKMLHLEDDETRIRTAIETALSDGSAFVEVGVKALILLGGASLADIGFGSAGGEISSVKVSLNFQPPHCIFEESLGGGSCPVLDESLASSMGGMNEAIMARFCPSIFTASDDCLLPGIAGTKANGKYLGAVRVEVAEVGCNNNGSVDNIWTSVNANASVEGLIELEDYLEHQQQHQQQVLVPAVSNGRRIGSFVVFLRIKNNANHVPTSAATSTTSASAASLGLLAMAGLSPVTEGLGSFIDSERPSSSLPAASPPSAADMRRRQVGTMGSFVSSRFLANHSIQVRGDAKVFGERYERYNQSLQSCMSGESIEDDSDVPLFQRRMPRAFRPSSSRDDALLTGIGFNVHVQTLSLNVLLLGQQTMQSAVTQCVTHGAPADHARGFFGGKKDGKKASEDNSPQGGLRRLEMKRLEVAKELDDCVTGLISAVGNHFKSRGQAASMRQQSGGPAPSKPSRHIPPNVHAVAHFRAKAGDCAKRLHSLTWGIAVRRSNCFSQALGIAVTSYMASLSDGGPAMSKGCASVWVRHGYLITFEGLLSAVGKELGMIEDASVAISMLRMVNVVLVADDGNTTANVNSQRISVPHSPCVRWVSLINSTAGEGPQIKSQYRLEIGVDPSYYQTRIPDPLKNGAAVRFFPILFQMGVDIRQWGAFAGRSVASQMKDKSKQNLDVATDAGENERGGGSILDDGDDDDDDTADVSDSEILYVLNVEAYRKLNAYAHSVYPTTPGVTTATATAPVFEQQQVQPLPVHPSLVTLSDAIKNSAGKMEHSVMDRAATATQRFGGGLCTFCKSGKDRTAMQVTFKQAQFVQRCIDRKDGVQLEDTAISYEEVVAKSTLMRKHGTRIPICEKNTGEPKFAFNPLQRKFMPEMLRPEVSLCTWSKPET